MILTILCSGAMSCPATSTGFQGRTLLEATTTVDWQECAEKCADKLSCEGWTFEDGGACKLFNSFTNIHSVSGWTSGDKSCNSKFASLYCKS